MKINIEKLKELCKKFTVSVSFNGFTPITQNVIDVNKLFDVVHEVSDVDKDEFIKNVNKNVYNSPELESIFRSVKCEGMFKIKGYSALSSDSYVECNSLNWLNDESR